MAFFEDPSWLAFGFNLLKDQAGYQRDHLLPRLKENGALEKKMAHQCGRDGGYSWAPGYGGYPRHC